MNSRWKTLLWNWLPVVLWLVVIAIESTAMLSSSNTGSLLNSVIMRIFGPVRPHTLQTLNVVLRKTGHFVGYAFLCVLFFRASLHTAVKGTGPLAVRMQGHYWRLAIASMAFTFLVASADEWHQSYLPSRTGAFRDVLLDTSGAVAILLATILLFRRKGPTGNQHKLGPQELVGVSNDAD